MPRLFVSGNLKDYIDGKEGDKRIKQQVVKDIDLWMNGEGVEYLGLYLESLF